MEAGKVALTLSVTATETFKITTNCGHVFSIVVAAI